MWDRAGNFIAITAVPRRCGGVVPLPGRSQALCASATETTSEAAPHAQRWGSCDRTDVLSRTGFRADLTGQRLRFLDGEKNFLDPSVSRTFFAQTRNRFTQPRLSQRSRNFFMWVQARNLDGLVRWDVLRRRMYASSTDITLRMLGRMPSGTSVAVLMNKALIVYST